MGNNREHPGDGGFQMGIGGPEPALAKAYEKPYSAAQGKQV